MSEDFLSRWSRRKREVAKTEQEQAKPAQPAAQAPEQTSESVANSGEPKADEVDLSVLPPLEEITGTTDISGFLRRGVPEELTRSALRKVWSSDPAIRDFVGLSENAWDFNDPTAIPGFGPIDFSPEQVRQMAAKLVGDVREAGEQLERVAATALQHDSIASAPGQAEETQNAVRDAPDENPVPPQVENAAQQDSAKEEFVPPPRRHGSALPR
jgi:hypothetical protein